MSDPYPHIKPYESERLRQVLGPGLRPGGLDLLDQVMARGFFAPGARILDAGCGQGASAGHLKDHYGLRAVGLDLSALLLAQARHRFASLPLIQGTAEKLPYAGNAFEGILCECVLSLVERPDQALAEFHRVLKPRGILVLTDVYARRPAGVPLRLDGLSLACCLKGAVGGDVMQERIQEAGFEIRLWEDHSHLLKLLAARLVFNYGSMAHFWEAECRQGDVHRIQSAVAGTRPGYGLLIAQKRGEKSDG